MANGRETGDVAEFLSQGIESYLQALVAIREFRRAMQRQARAVAEPRLPDLVAALGGGAADAATGVADYANPSTISDRGDWPGDHAWIAVTAKLAGFGVWYLGMLWHRPNDQATDAKPGVVATMDTGRAEVRNRLVARLEVEGLAHGHNFWGNEVSLWRPISPDQAGEFPARLDALIVDWTNFWRTVGGLRAL